MRPSLFAFLLLTGSLSGAAALAEDYVITLKDHQFTPQNLVIPAGQKIDLKVKNEQGAPAEFESSQLGREKVVSANSQIIVKLGPLEAGNYSYVDDFHEETTGTITVK